VEQPGPAVGVAKQLVVYDPIQLFLTARLRRAQPHHPAATLPNNKYATAPFSESGTAGSSGRGCEAISCI